MLTHARVNADDFYVPADYLAPDYHEDLDFELPVFEVLDTSHSRSLPALQVVTLTHTPTDTILAQRPALPRSGELRPEYYPGKRFGLEDGQFPKLPYNQAGWFTSLSYAIDGVDNLHEALERARDGVDSDGHPSYVVAGALAEGADPRSAPRSKKGRQKTGSRYAPKGLDDAAHNWLIIDVDKVPNTGGVDPRLGASARQAAVAALTARLPQAMRSARCSWQLSSSCCVKGVDGLPLALDTTPAILGAHLRYWLDTPVAEVQRRSLLARLQLVVPEVDPSVATYNQAVFLAPRFEGDMRNPLPLRSGLDAPGKGNDSVCLADLLAQLPELPGKPARVKAQSAEKTEAQKARKTHDTLIRGARRTAAREALTQVTTSRIPVGCVVLRGAPRYRGPQEWVLHLSRQGKLWDIVDLVDDRRTRLPEWANGVPPGKRRQTMMVVAGLLSHLVAASNLTGATLVFAARLTTQEWIDEEWIARGMDATIVAKAHEAEALELAGKRSVGVRHDPWLARIMALLEPTPEEMVRLELRALRTNAARKEVHRRAKGVPTMAERRAAQAATSEAATQPWVALGISESTYRRRKRAGMQQTEAKALDLDSATLSEQGLDDVLQLLSESLTPSDDFGAGAVLRGALRHLSLGTIYAHLPLAERVSVAAFKHETPELLAAKEGLEDAHRLCMDLECKQPTPQPALELVDYILCGPLGVLPRALAAGDTGGKFSATRLRDLARQHSPLVLESKLRDMMWIDRNEVELLGVQADSDTAHAPMAPAARYPGADIAGCSRRTWARRQQACKPPTADLKPVIQATEEPVKAHSYW